MQINNLGNKIQANSFINFVIYDNFLFPNNIIYFPGNISHIIRFINKPINKQIQWIKIYKKQTNKIINCFCGKKIISFT